jgi:hypothetical protein
MFSFLFTAGRPDSGFLLSTPQGQMMSNRPAIAAFTDYSKLFAM